MYYYVSSHLNLTIIMALYITSILLFLFHALVRSYKRKSRVRGLWTVLPLAEYLLLQGMGQDGFFGTLATFQMQFS